MNIMGIGPQEMMVIAVIALLVFGPGKLPEVMGQAGKLVRDFRRMSSELSGEFEKTIAEARDATSGLQAELGGMSKEVNSVTNSVKKDLGLKNSGVSGRSKGTTGKAATTAKSGSKTTTTSTSTSKKTGTSSTSTSKAGAKASAASNTAAKSGTASSTTKSTAAKKPPAPVASREDPAADVSLFEPAPVERPKRARKAVPSVISDPTPRPTSAMDDVIPSVRGDRETAVAASDADDALNRARQRRRTAGYARSST